MSLRLGRAFVNGGRRVLTRTGGILLVALVTLQLLVQTSVNTAVLGFLPPEATGRVEAQFGLTLPVPGSVAVAFLLIALVLNAAFFVALVRGLTRPLADLGSFPGRLYTRRIGRATLSLLAGGLAAGIAVSIGMVLFVLPGIFLAVCVLFFPFEVGVEDERAIAALKRSWGRSRGNRLRLAVVVVLAGVVGAVIGAVGAVFDVARAPVAGDVLANLLSSVLFLGLYGVIADAYVQLRDDGRGDVGGSGTSAPVDGGVVSEQ